MEVELRVMGAPITLKDVEFKGCMRVTLEPLITDIPIVGSVARFSYNWLVILPLQLIKLSLSGVNIISVENTWTFRFITKEHHKSRNYANFRKPSKAITFLDAPCIDFDMDGVAAVVNAPGVYQGIKAAISSVLTGKFSLNLVFIKLVSNTLQPTSNNTILFNNKA